MTTSNGANQKLRYSNKHWFIKSIFGLTLTFFLSLGITGLLLNFLLGDIYIYSPQGQFLMWIMSPLWAITFSFCYFFRTTLSMTVTLGLMNIGIWLFIWV